MPARVELDAGDLERLERLRSAFLAGRGRSPWRDARDLELYDATFARRIAWKWDAVLGELERRAAGPGAERVTLLDFGCGTGVASRAWLERFGAERCARVHLVDAFGPAQEFARARIAERWPSVEIELGAGTGAPDVLLASHVASELAAPELMQLVERCRAARTVVWVEPGTPAASATLVRARDALLAEFDVLAPCTHSSRCPLHAGLGPALAGGTALADVTAGTESARRSDWCHFFARPAPEVFTDSGWQRLGRELGIDLRSLPYSFVALRRRTAESARATDDPALVRLLGRPRLEKGRSLVDACSSAGLRRLRLLDRDARTERTRFERPEGECLLYQVDVEGERIRRAEPRA